MKSVYDARRANLRRLIVQWGGPTSLAIRLGHSNGSYIAQLAGPSPSRDVSEKTARAIEDKLGLPRLWMDSENHGITQLNDVLLGQCLRAVHAAMEDLGRSLTPESLSEVVTLVYERSRTNGDVCEESYIQRLVRLAR